MGIRSFFKKLRIADEGLKASLAAAGAISGVKPKIEKKKIHYYFPKWMKITARVMLILAIASLAALALTSPSYKEFKAFTPERNTSLHYAEWKKVHNYLLWSVYQKNVFERERTGDDFILISSQQYQGMLLNFIPVQ